MKTVKCSFCGHTMRLSEGMLGGMVECERCGKRVSLYHATSDAMVQCTKCGKYIEKSAFEIHQLACLGAHHQVKQESGV